ncbi:MAG: hypothetical protein LH660_21220 [Phormidesmis sp. CAN_BIN36]|nr:hypothetical protein [Phormidesmis sp. CAN_BIN36]
MTPIKEELLQAIETAPEGEIVQTLIYLKSLLQNQPSLRPGSGKSILRHAGKWQGDDFEDCLQSVYDTRSEAQF